MGGVRSVVRDRRFFVAALLTLFLLCTLLVPTEFAYASIADDINSWLCGVLRDCCNWMFSAQVEVLKGIGYDGILSASFPTMLSSSGSVSMYDLAHGVWSAAILPIGCGILSMVFCVKLIQVSQRMEGSGSMPAVKDVVFMLVFFAIFLYLIQNSFDLMAAIYEVVGIAIDRVQGLFGSGSTLDLSAVSIVTTDDDVASLVALLLVAITNWVVVLVAYVVALVVCWARALQIYILAALSPLPLSLIALDETRQMGIGYIRNFFSVCLAGLIILVLLVAFPLVLGGIAAVNPGTGTPVDAVANGLTYALQYMAMCILLILSLVKSGTWAREVLGG